MIDKQLTVFCIKLMYTTHYAKYWGIILINTNNISTIYVFSLLHYSMQSLFYYISVSQMSPLKLLSQDKIGDFLNLLLISRDNLRRTDPCLGSYG